MEIGKRIAASRKKIKMSSLELAEVLGKSQPAVQAWESGRSLPPTQDIPRLCDALGITLDALFGRGSKSDVGGDDDVVLNAYHKLDPQGRAVVLTLLLRLSTGENDDSTLQSGSGNAERRGRGDSGGE